MGYNSIGISGLPGSGKTSLINQLSTFLGWETISIGKDFREEYEKWQNAISDSQAKKETFESWWANHVDNSTIRSINDRAHTKLSNGNIILDSRYIPVNVNGLENVACVFLTAAPDIRAKRALASGKYPYADGWYGSRGTAGILFGREQEERRRGSEIFRIDYTLPSHYHLVLNSGKLTISQEADLVLALLGKKDY